VGLKGELRAKRWGGVGGGGEEWENGRRGRGGEMKRGARVGGEGEGGRRPGKREKVQRGKGGGRWRRGGGGKGNGVGGGGGMGGGEQVRGIARSPAKVQWPKLDWAGARVIPFGGRDYKSRKKQRQ